MQVVTQSLPEGVVDRSTFVREVSLPPVGVSNPVALVTSAGVLTAVAVRCKFHVDYLITRQRKPQPPACYSYVTECTGTALLGEPNVSSNRPPVITAV